MKANKKIQPFTCHCLSPLKSIEASFYLDLKLLSIDVLSFLLIIYISTFSSKPLITFNQSVVIQVSFWPEHVVNDCKSKEKVGLYFIGRMWVSENPWKDQSRLYINQKAGKFS